MEGIDPTTSDGESFWVFPKLVEGHCNSDEEGMKYEGIKTCDNIEDDDIPMIINPPEPFDAVPSQASSVMENDDSGRDEALREDLCVKRRHYLFLATFVVAVFFSIIGRLTYDFYDKIFVIEAKLKDLEDIQLDSLPSANKTEHNTPAIIVLILTTEAFNVSRRFDDALFASFSSFDNVDEMRIIDQTTYLDIVPTYMKHVVILLCHTPTNKSLAETMSEVVKRMEVVSVRSFHFLQEFLQSHSSILRQLKTRILVMLGYGKNAIVKSMDVMKVALHNFLGENPSIHDDFSFYRDIFKTSVLTTMNKWTEVVEVIMKVVSDPRELKEAFCVATMNAKATLVHNYQRLQECIQSINQVFGDMDFHECMLSINEALRDIDYPVGL